MFLNTRRRRDLSAEQLMEISARLREFDFYGKKIRALYDEDGAWLILADVLTALDYKVKASHIAKSLRPGEISLKDIGAKNALVNCINKSGLYAITCFANKPMAKFLHDWCQRRIFIYETADTPAPADDLTPEIVRLLYLLTSEEKAEVLAQIKEVVGNRKHRTIIPEKG